MRDLFDDLERDARKASERLEATGKLPAGFTAEHYPMTDRERFEAKQLMAALMLAEGADDFLAIIRTGKVPRAWYKRRLSEIARRR